MEYLNVNISKVREAVFAEDNIPLAEARGALACEENRHRLDTAQWNVASMFVIAGSRRCRKLYMCWRERSAGRATTLKEMNHQVIAKGCGGREATVKAFCLAMVQEFRLGLRFARNVPERLGWRADYVPDEDQMREQCWRGLGWLRISEACEPRGNGLRSRSRLYQEEYAWPGATASAPRFGPVQFRPGMDVLDRRPTKKEKGRTPPTFDKAAVLGDLLASHARSQNTRETTRACWGYADGKPKVLH